MSISLFASSVVTPCPQGISIFRVLYLPIYIKQIGAGRVLAKGIPDWLAKAEECIECGLCETRCPFHLHIISGLKQNLALARKHLPKRRAGKSSSR